MRKTAPHLIQKGFAHILILLAAVGLVAFLIISNTVSFQNGLFGSLFPKSTSLAANIPGVTIVDSSNNVLVQTTSSTVRVQLAPPWPLVADAGKAGSVAGVSTTTFQVKSGKDDVNEENGKYDAYGANSSGLWLGNGQSTSTSFTGIRFTGVTIPKGATITSAKLQVTSASSQWIGMKLKITAENIGNSSAFSASNLPSKRAGTAASVSHSSGSKWNANTAYTLDEMKSVIQEVVNRSDWTSGNALSVILKGTGSPFGRKFVTSFNGSSADAPKLIVTYDTESGSSATPAPTRAAVSPSPIVPSPSPAPAQTIAMATLAEDSGFTQNVMSIKPFTTNPTYANYTFSNTSLGTKTLYGKFTSSSGAEQTFSTTVQLVAPTASVTPMASPGTPIDGHPVSASYGIWDPANPTYAAAGPQKYPTCTKAFHDSFKVLASDGKWYPTWHPVVATDPTTGIKCSFGHDHGRNPSQSALWSQIQNYFYYDANHNGVMDPPEQQVAGLPFGYANEQLDAYWASTGVASMRHEDHVGHKVDFLNGEADTAEHFFGNSATGGVVIPLGNPASTSDANKWLDSGAKCTFLTKVHQGVSTKDAFTNNLHEVQFFMNCTGPTTATDLKINMAEMITFGAPGEFTNLCDGAGDRTTPVVLGKDAMNQNWPGTRGSGFRNINQRSCIAKYFLVPQGSFGMNMYEAWAGGLTIDTGSKNILSGGNLLFDVEDANRYYYPGQPNNVGYSMDLCYEQLPGGLAARGGSCDYATNYHTIQGITWNDTRSAFKGVNRGMYFQPPFVHNGGGANFWYTDPFGNHASTASFPGSIRQEVSAKNVDGYNINGLATNPRVTDRQYLDEEGTIHAPN